MLNIKYIFKIWLRLGLLIGPDKCEYASGVIMLQAEPGHTYLNSLIFKRRVNSIY